MKKKLLLSLMLFGAIQLESWAQATPASAVPAPAAVPAAVVVPAPVPDFQPAQANCSLTSFYTSSISGIVGNGVTVQKRSANLQERLMLKLSCANSNPNYSLKEVKVEDYKYQSSSLVKCTSQTTELCYENEAAVIGSASANNLATFSLLNLKPNEDIEISGSKKITLRLKMTVSLNSDGTDSVKYDDVEFDKPVKIKHLEQEPLSCEITIGGAVGEEKSYRNNCLSGNCDYNSLTTALVAPGEVVAFVSTKGTQYEATPTIEWFLDDNAVPGVAIETLSHTYSSPTNIKVKITRASGTESAACMAKIKPNLMAAGIKVSIRKAGDCEVFKDMKKVFYRKKEAGGWSMNTLTSTVPSFTKPGSSNLIEYKGNPYAGVVNLAMNQGVLESNEFGDISMPILRTYESAVIQVYSTKNLKKAIFEARLNPSDYKTAIFEALENSTLADNDTIIMRSFLRTKRADGEPIEFLPANASGAPRDRIIPFAYKACDPMSMVSIKAANGWSEQDVTSIKNMGLCLTTRPMKFADFKNGSISVDLLHIAPESANIEYPVSLLRAKANPKKCASATATSSDPETPCWSIPPSAMPSTEIDGESHSVCQLKKYTCVSKGKIFDYYGRDLTPACAPPTGGVDGGGSCGNNCQLQSYMEFKPGCVVAENDQNECTSSIAMRFDGYNQMMIAGLGCAVTYDKKGEVTSDVPVSATLEGQGIIPYTTFGNSAPKHFTDYGVDKGYACIPCRFAPNPSSVNVIPVDQTGNGVKRKPIYTFTKKITLPASCSQEVNMQVRYFGSSACDGVNAPAGHFCSSGNIQVQNCPSTEGGAGGNIAGKFTVRLCAGSQFGATDVAASWSPIILDMKGRGIEISRHFKHSVMFDIKGRGAKDRIDWPMNTADVAFLVRPNKKGKVESIKELFGEYKKDKNGFEALKAFDSNKDGVISEKDKNFGKLALWFDYNRDAIAQEGEIVDLPREGVTNISLKYLKADAEMVSGKGLNSLYFNKMLKRFLNAKDVYFYEYNETGHKVKINKK
ncbi:MAG: hypothetical protein KBD76_05135 [Bacteriovorax sp.]|nr:hypothetical protein [Bacteriovorax sp.]